MRSLAQHPLRRGPAERPRRTRAERLAAWLYTGPVGHLWSVMADVVVLWVRYGLFKVRRLAGAGRRSSARR